MFGSKNSEFTRKYVSNWLDAMTFGLSSSDFVAYSTNPIATNSTASPTSAYEQRGEQHERDADGRAPERYRRAVAQRLDLVGVPDLGQQQDRREDERAEHRGRAPAGPQRCRQRGRREQCGGDRTDRENGFDAG